MKKSIFLTGSLIFAAILSGCTDDRFNNNVENPVQEGDEILFGSTLSGDADVISTKTVYGDRNENGVPVYWEADGSDEIAIFCLQSSQPANHLVNYKITPDATDKATASTVTKVNTAEAGLQWGDKDTEHRFYAFYPASAVKGSAEENSTGQITANIPVTQQVQEWRKGTFTSSDTEFNGRTCYFGLPNMDYAYMYAYNAVTPSQVQDGQFIDLQFHNLVTVLDITIQGPSSGTATITNINVDAIEGTQPILTGDFTCNIRNTETGVIGTCDPVGDFNEERGRISIPCYDKKTGQFIQLGPDELLNVKAYIIPQDKNTVTQRTLRVTVSLLNGAPCRKTLQTADVTPHKINRVILPPLTIGGTNYWMSSLDPNIYISELSIPGSKFSVLTNANGASPVYQNATIADQFKDGVRAFILQTATKTKDLGFNYDNVYVVCDNKNREIKSLSAAISEIASYLNTLPEGKKNEFAFVMLTYLEGDVPNFSGEDKEQYWLDRLNYEVNQMLNDKSKYRIYEGEVNNNTTIADVAGKIILKVNYNSNKMIDGYNGSAPMLFSYWGGYYGPMNDDKVSYYQDSNKGMPMNWKTPQWYLNATDAGLRWYYQEVTHVGDGGEATKTQKETFIKKLFTESVNMYNNDTEHKTWFMNDLGGRYTSTNSTTELATDMNNLGVRELQNRAENAGLGLVFMNFADKQSTSGALYKSDWLIQTLIDNNFKFALRKKGSTTTYDSSYISGGNVIE